MLVPVNTFEIQEDESLEVQVASTASNDDWIRSGRLAQSKSKSAKKKLKKLDEARMKYFIED